MKHKIWINFIIVFVTALVLVGVVVGEQLVAQAAPTESRPHPIRVDNVAFKGVTNPFQSGGGVNVDYLGQSSALAYAVDVAVSGDYAYVADNWQGGLYIINVSDSSTPTEVSFFDSPGFTWGVALSGNYAYLADGLDGGLRIIDVSDPTAPTEIGYYVTPGDGNGVAVSGDYAYVADGTEGLRVIDISDPVSPSEVGYYDTADIAYDVAVAGNHAYVANGWEGLRIIDVSNPATPTETGFYDTPGTASGVSVAGHYTYVVDWSSGLHIIDVSNPGNPIEVGYRIGGGNDVAISGNHVYMAGGSGGLSIIDVSDPAAPTETGFYTTPYEDGGTGLGVAVAEDLVYLADGEVGLIILRFTGLTETSVTITSDSSEPSQVGEPFSVDIEVTPGSAWSLLPSGVVTVTVAGEAESCTVNLADIGYSEDCVLTLNAPGTYVLAASYSGDNYYLPSSTTEEHTVTQPSMIYLPCLYGNYCPDFFDDFSDPISGWDTGENEYVRYEYLNGEYRVLTKNDQYGYLFAAPTCDRENYTVEVDARWVGPTGASYGIVFGITGDYDQYYTFEINTDYREFGLWRFDGYDYQTIVPITYSWAINYGNTTNHLKVVRYSDQISLYINGVNLGVWFDGNITSNTGAGILSAPYYEEPYSDARFDNFSMSKWVGSTLETENEVVVPVPLQDSGKQGDHREFKPADED